MTEIDLPALADWIEGLTKSGRGIGVYLEADDRKKIVSALRNASAPDGVVVKPLEWTPEHNRPDDSPAWNASAPELGVFFRVFKAWWGKEDKWGYVYDGFYRTEQEAKAAAQSDYEQRIRSALVAAPVPDGAVKPHGYLYAFDGCMEVSFSYERKSEYMRNEPWTETPLYAAPQSFTSGHVAGQREMQERAVAAARSVGQPVGASDGCGTYIPGTSADAARAIASLPVSAGEAQS